MSVSLAESELKRARSALEAARKKQAAEEKKAADAEKAALSKEQSASRTSSASSMQSYLRDAERKRADVSKARSAAAGHSAKVATAQEDVHKAEVKLTKARDAEQKKHDDQSRRERQKRETEERRYREQAERIAKQTAREREARRQKDAARDGRLDVLGFDVAAVRENVANTRAVLESRPWENVPARITILIITAEPEGLARLRIDREIREIQDQVRSSDLRDSINFEYRPASRFIDMIQHLNETEPDVVHFSGHGANGGIALHDESDHLRELTNEELDRLLAVAPKPLKLVVFNSCNSAEQARVAVRHASAAVGMQQSIEDEAARVFAGQLYNSLGFGRSLSLAMQQATLYVEMKLNRTSGEPTLVMGEGVEADDLVIVNPGT